MTDSDNYLTPIVSCLECREIKSAKGLFSHFIMSHTEDGKKRAKESLRIASIKANENRKTRMQLDIENKMCDYYNNPKICDCGKQIDFKKRNNKFCSQSCGAHFSNIRESDDKKQKRIGNIKKTMRNKQKQGILQTICKISFCVECGDIIKNKRAKTCSMVCRKNLNVKNGVYAGKCSASKRKDQKRSKDEIELFHLCEKYFVNITHNDNTIANGWDADILLHDHKVAILWNGPWHYKEMGFSNHSLKQVQNRDRIKIKEFCDVGWKVEIFEDRHYTPKSAFEILKLKYGGSP